jgi:anti-sigma-K factor RskA
VRTSRPEPHTLAGAYAMDALDRRNTARFERHLACCEECAREVSGLQEATARLAAAAAAQPPAALKARLLAQIARTRQLPSAGQGQPLAGERPAGRATGRPRGSSQWRRAGLTLGLSLVVALVAATLWLIGPAPGPGQQSAQATSVAAVLTAPDATVIKGQVRTGGSATVVMSHRERMLVFAAVGLRSLPATRCYELWLVGPGRDVPAGLLPMPKHGMTGPVVAAGLRPGERLGLSVEPSAGSRHPTSFMILELPL